MPFKKGQPSANPSGRPKINGAIRARARTDSHKAYDRLLAALDDDKQGATAAVQILKLAGVSFASDAEETVKQAEASKAETQPTLELAIVAGSPESPLN